VPLELVREVYPYEDFELLASRDEHEGIVTDLFDGI
jgi:hypothetical protein